MKPLMAKEVRLLLPAFGLALLLAIVPIWLVPEYGRPRAIGVIIHPFWFGVVLLALCSFGREFGMGTFSLLLAQPIERARIWRTKVAVLGGAMAIVLAAWCISCGVWAHGGAGKSAWWDLVLIGGTAVAVSVSGGLWSTLLVRQVVGAFWFTLLIPGAIVTAVGLEEGRPRVLLAALGLYSMGGFWWAWRYFLGAEETGWTGGLVTLPGRRAGAVGVGTARGGRPVRALFYNELRLHQVGLAGMGWLLVVHLGAVAMRRTSSEALGDYMRGVLEMFGAVWLLAPLLVGCASVAEERKLGTLDERLCLPVSRAVQFGVKLLVVVVLGGLLSAALCFTVEEIGGGPSFVGRLEPSDLLGTGVVFVVLALVGLYASTLAANIIQAAAIGVVTGVGLLVLAAMVTDPYGLVLRLWQGKLGAYVAVPVLGATFGWLTWSNFGSVSETGRLWRRNLLGLGGGLALTVGLTTAIFHRAWEWIGPLEPAHGPARILAEGAPEVSSSGSGLAVARADGGFFVGLSGYGGAAVAARLPGGRLWADRIAYQPGQEWLRFGMNTGFAFGGSWVSLGGNRFLPGSDWADGAASFCDTVAIRADGTLWVSEKPRQPWVGYPLALPPAEEPASLVRFGAETNWQEVVRESGFSVVLLKHDGSLWRWGPGFIFNEKKPWPGLRTFEPQRIGTESGWARILSDGYSIYVWKDDGRASMLNCWVGDPKNAKIYGTVGLRRCPSFDRVYWRSVGPLRQFRVGLREDGTLWAWNSIFQPAGPGGEGPRAELTQIGNEARWKGLGVDNDQLVALKADGTLWRLPLLLPEGVDWRQPIPSRLFSSLEPVRLSRHHDWVAVGHALGGIVSLAADGGLWCWLGADSWRSYDHYGHQPMLLNSRKPVLIENIFARE